LPPRLSGWLTKLANKRARAIRDVVFSDNLNAGHSGPLIVDEGDSWFQYPIFNEHLTDTIDILSEAYLIKSLSAGGAELADIVERDLYYTVIESLKADIFLFSASGNDILGGGNVANLLIEYQSGMSVEDIVNRGEVDKVLGVITGHYETVITRATQGNPKVQIAFHGYDAPVPRKKGKALGVPLSKLDIPQNMQLDVVKNLVRLLNERLIEIAEKHENTTHIDCRGLVGNDGSNWLFDEIHPKSEGYRKIASKFETFITSVKT